MAARMGATQGGLEAVEAMAAAEGSEEAESAAAEMAAAKGAAARAVVARAVVAWMAA